MVTLTNDGDDVDAVFILNGVTYTLVPGATEVVTIGTLADGTHTIPLSVNGADKSFEVTVDCDRPGQPTVEIATDCVNEDGQVIVTLKNIGGQLPITFIVEGQSYDVTANSNRDCHRLGRARRSTDHRHLAQRCRLLEGGRFQL